MKFPTFSLGMLLFLSVIALFSLPECSRHGRAEAQSIESPDREFLFLEDRRKKRTERKRRLAIQAKQREVAKAAKASGLPFDINGTTINYDTANRVVRGEGGIIVGYGSSVIEAEEGQFSVDTKEAQLKGDVRITDITGTLSAETANVNLDDGSGVLTNTEIYFTDGDYHLYAKEAKRRDGDVYDLSECSLTTCNCPEADAKTPWTIDGKEASITKNGYGKVWDAWLRWNDVPVLYTPYLIFPVKNERQSGFLPARFGSGRKSGFSLDLPLYLVYDRSSDSTITAIYNANARVGVDADYRKIFSRDRALEMGGIYLNESLRGEDNLGTITTGFADPTRDKNRFGGYLYFSSQDKLFGQDLQTIVDGHLASDNLFIREYDRPEVAAYNSRFITSTAVSRMNFLDTYSLELSSEYNRAVYDPQETVFQRVPEVALDGLHIFRPFGENPLGAKVQLYDTLNFTNFVREDLYDGGRGDWYERVKVPFHVKNYVDVSLGADVHATSYNLTDTGTRRDNRQGSALPQNSDRVIPGFSGQISTVVEKVAPVGEWNPLKALAELGAVGRSSELVRVKHTLEPMLKYRFVPYVDQKENPQFDSYDRLARRNVITYQLTQRFYGRFEARDEYLYGIEETTPEVKDLDVLGTRRPIDDAFDFGQSTLDDDFRAVSSGLRRELFNIRVAQSYDVHEERNDTALETERGLETNPFSDIDVRSTLLPNEYLRFNGGFTLSPQSTDFTSYFLGTQLLDKRGDQVRIRLTFVDSATLPTRQVDTSAELRITDRMKLGYYARYDDESGEFLENKAGVRFKSKCNCWVFDVDVVDRLNPDETKLMFNLTLVGLGEFGSGFLTKNNREDRT